MGEVTIMATCGHCTKTNVTVAHVRTCGQAGGAVATAERQLPELHPGNVVTVDLEDGYWLVEAMLAGDQFQCMRVQRINERSVVFPLFQVELVFPNANAAADYDIALRSEATKRRNRETLHGDADYCRGCAKGWAGAKWHRDGCPVIADRMAKAAAAVHEDHEETRAYEREMRHDASGATLRDSNPWAQVDGLRERVAQHLHRETRQGGSPRVEGRFAIVVDGATKFLRIKKITDGRWAGRVFVDSQASDDYYPVKAPATLLAYLSAVLADPQAAAKLYADELDSCSDCGRTLTNDESRARGIGPECWSKH